MQLVAPHHREDELIDQVKTGIADIRRLVNDLRPPILDQLGLVSAIEEARRPSANRTASSQ